MDDLGWFGRADSAVEITETLADVGCPRAGRLLHVRPQKDGEGLEASLDLLRSLHQVETGFLGWRNKSNPHAFEIWYRQGTIQFMFFAPTDRSTQTLRKQLDAHYPAAEIQECDLAFPPFRTGEYVAGTRMELSKHTFFPLKTPNGADPFETDPYRALTSAMLGDLAGRVVVQVIFRPAKPTWTSGGVFGNDVLHVGESLKQGEVRGYLNPHIVDASHKQKRTAKIVQAQEAQPAFHVNIRVISISPTQEAAEARAEDVGTVFRQLFTNTITEQGLTDTSVQGWHLRRFVNRMAKREWTDRDMVLTIPELAGVAHLPDESIETPDVDWNRTQKGTHLPADAEHPQDNVR